MAIWPTAFYNNQGTNNCPYDIQNENIAAKTGIIFAKTFAFVIPKCLIPFA